MRDTKRFLFLMFSLIIVQCAHSRSEPDANTVPVAPPAPPKMEEAAPTPPVPPAASAPARPPAPPVLKDEIWRVKHGKIAGLPKPSQIGRFKNKKLPGYTTDMCFHFKTFAVVETTSTGEIGSAEIVVRYPTEGQKDLCSPEFKGKYANLKIVEGHLAGVAGDYIVVDGDDKSEGLPEFQLFQVSDGKEVFRARRNGDEELVVVRKDGKTSLTFFAKLKVTCELAADGEVCWKKVLAQNEIKNAVVMPDCKTAFAAAKMELHELALVTTRARVSDLAAPKVEFLGGKATCMPAPP